MFGVAGCRISVLGSVWLILRWLGVAWFWVTFWRVIIDWRWWGEARGAW